MGAHNSTLDHFQTIITVFNPSNFFDILPV